jgi:hypothetical protein
MPFSPTMMFTVAHGLGIKNTIDGKGTVRGAEGQLQRSRNARPTSSDSTW